MKARRVQFSFGKTGNLCADGKDIGAGQLGPASMQAETELRNDLDLDDRETVLTVYDRDG